ncbi:MAG: tyrosine-type recombinase/integrase [Verrucomicrobiota bacterium]
MSSHIELSNGRDTVKIYTSSARGKTLFQVSFYRAGRRERRSFANRAKAKREAKLILTQLGSTTSDAEKAVTTPEVESLVAARKALEGIDCPLHIAVEGFAKATKALGAPSNPVASLLEAVAFYRKHNPENAERIPLKDLTERFVKSRRSRGLSESWIQTCKGMMEALVKKFPNTGCDLPKGADVTKWLEERYENPTTRNSILKKFKTLASWAKRQRLVSHETISDIEFWKVKAGEVAIYTPEEMKKILTGMPSEMVPIVAICAFAGVRVSEAFRLDWKDISLERGYITVAATKTKTAARRLVPIQENLKAWLTPYVKKEGPVATFFEAYFNDTIRARKLPRKRNAFRHSYISYRLAEMPDAPRVALEAGNSPAMIFKHYRELVTPEEGKQWFGIMPDGVTASEPVAATPKGTAATEQAQSGATAAPIAA